MNSFQLELTPVEVRVLGSLIEKDITTPDYYPLSVNALVNACNQKNNRDPVMTLDENAVRDALSSLQERRMAGPASGADARYWVARADDLTVTSTFRLYPDGGGEGTAPDGSAHTRFRTWKEALRDHR